MIDLPEANDWITRCGGHFFFWAFSKSLGMRVRLESYDNLDTRSDSAYYKQLGESLSIRFKSKGLFSRYKIEGISDLFLSMHVDANEKMPLFPQEDFYKAAIRSDEVMIMLNITMFPKSDIEKRKLAVETLNAWPNQPVKTNAVSPFVTFKGLSSDGFSEASIGVLENVLKCDQSLEHVDCAILKRFKDADHLPIDTEGIWAGVSNVYRANKFQKIQTEDLVGFLYLKNGKGTLRSSTPTEEEKTEFIALISVLRSGKAPSEELSFMKRIQTSEFAVKDLGFLSLHTQGLHLEMYLESVSSNPQVFLRENENEIIAIEILRRGLGFEIGVFPKP